VGVRDEKSREEREGEDLIRGRFDLINSLPQATPGVGQVDEGHVWGPFKAKIY
jgi:hypothetical protein